jgi:hypothetical protein
MTASLDKTGAHFGAGEGGRMSYALRARSTGPPVLCVVTPWSKVRARAPIPADASYLMHDVYACIILDIVVNGERG